MFSAPWKPSEQLMILKAIVMDELEVCLSVQQKLFNNISYFTNGKHPQEVV